MPEQANGADPSERDPFVDFVRAASLVVVVLWHWVFTVVRVAVRRAPRVEPDRLHVRACTW